MLLTTLFSFLIIILNLMLFLSDYTDLPKGIFLLTAMIITAAVCDILLLSISFQNSIFTRIRIKTKQLLAV